MRAKDVMTPHVVTVKPGSTVREVAELLLKHGISAVPVVDDTDHLVGIVSEGDLIRRAEIGTDERKRSWWLRLFSNTANLAAEYVKTHSNHVRDVMTKNVITVSEDTPLSDIAALFEKHRIKRVPVTRDGRLVGIVSRANLIQALAAKSSTLTPAAADDGTIRLKVLEALRSQPWSHPESGGVTVTNGVVGFWGIYWDEEERRASIVAAENVPGVREVVDHRTPLVAYPHYA